MRNGDEIAPSTEEEGAKEEEEEEEEEEEGEAKHVTFIQATENCRQKRSLCHGFSRFIATKRRKMTMKMKKKSEPVSDSVQSRSQISCCLLPACFTGPQSLTPDSPLSAPAFQSLIEKNDFYSTECNVHRNLSLFADG